MKTAQSAPELKWLLDADSGGGAGKHNGGGKEDNGGSVGRGGGGGGGGGGGSGGSPDIGGGGDHGVVRHNGVGGGRGPPGIGKGGPGKGGPGPPLRATKDITALRDNLDDSEDDDQQVINSMPNGSSVLSSYFFLLFYALQQFVACSLNEHLILCFRGDLFNVKKLIMYLCDKNTNEDSQFFQCFYHVNGSSYFLFCTQLKHANLFE